MTVQTSRSPGTPARRPETPTPSRRAADAPSRSTPGRAGRICKCGHTEVAHYLNRKKVRTSCSRLEGPHGTPCGCRKFTPRQGDQS